MTWKFDLVFDIILIHYYSINILLKVFYYFFIGVGGLILVFGTDAIHKCSAATENSNRVCTIGKKAWLKNYLGKITIMVARRKPIYNIGMLCAITIMVARRKPIYNIGMLCAITITVARRKPIYNIGLLCALVRLRSGWFLEYLIEKVV